MNTRISKPNNENVAPMKMIKRSVNPFAIQGSTTKKLKPNATTPHTASTITLGPRLASVSSIVNESDDSMSDEDVDKPCLNRPSLPSQEEEIQFVLEYDAKQTRHDLLEKQQENVASFRESNDLIESKECKDQAKNPVHDSDSSPLHKSSSIPTTFSSLSLSSTVSLMNQDTFKYTEYPLDISLKSGMLMSCQESAVLNQLCNWKQHRIQIQLQHVPIQDYHPDIMKMLTYYMYPHQSPSPAQSTALSALFSKEKTAEQSGISGSLFQGQEASEMAHFKSLEAEWLSSFTYLYHQFQHHSIPYFYYKNTQFTVYFEQGPRAILTQATRGLRKLLVAQGLHFTPITHSNKVSQAHINPNRLLVVERGEANSTTYPVSSEPHSCALVFYAEQVDQLFSFLSGWIDPRVELRAKQGHPTLISPRPFLNSSFKVVQMSLGQSMTSSAKSMKTVYIIKLSGLLMRDAIYSLLKHVQQSVQKPRLEGTLSVWQDTSMLNSVTSEQEYHTVRLVQLQESLVGWK